MSDFEPAMALVLKHEGGYSNDPHDHGGETKYGISKAAFPYLDIKNLTLLQAKQVYLDHFWLPYQIAAINNQHIANFIFDLLVNMGPGHDTQIVQRACNNLENDLDVDGRMGPHTLQAINGADPDKLKAQIVIEANKFYINLHQPVFLKQWLARVKDDEANA